MRGRKPKPQELKKLQGTYQPCRDKGGIPAKSFDFLPDPPEWLSKEGKDIYRTVGDKIHGFKILNEINLQNFVLYCHFVGLVLAYVKKNPGLDLITSSSTSDREFRKIMRVWESAYKLGGDFGLTPSMQQRIAGFEPKKEKSKFQRFMEGEENYLKN